MAGLKKIINSVITKESSATSQASFGSALVIGESTILGTKRIEIYSDEAAMKAAGWGQLATLEPELLAARAWFSQSPTPDSIYVGQKMAADASWDVALDACQREQSGWYALGCTSRVKANQLSVAAWAEANKHPFLAVSSDADIINVSDSLDSSSISATFKANSYEYCVAMYHSAASTQYLDLALLGKILIKQPGSYTAEHKVLSAVTPDRLTDTQIQNLVDKRTAYFVTIGAKNVIQNVQVGANEWLDTVIFIDWLNARMAERIWGILSSVDKVPMTDVGAVQLDSEVGLQLDEGVTVGGLTSDPKPTHKYVPVAKMSAAQRKSRNYNKLTWEAQLAGAIHSLVPISGTILY